MAGLTGVRWTTRKGVMFRPPRHYKPYIKLHGVIPEPDVIRTKKGAVRLLRHLEGEEWAAVDTEYDTSVDPVEVVGWSLSTGDNRIVVMPEATRYFKRWLEDPEKKKILHYAKADIDSFATERIDIRKSFAADTMSLDWLVDENRRKHGLKGCARDWLTIPLVDFDETFGIVPPGKKKLVVPNIKSVVDKQFVTFVDYASADAYATYHLFCVYRKILLKQGLWHKYYLRHGQRFGLTLKDVSSRGICLNVPRVKEIGRELDKTMVRAQHVFMTYAPSVSVTRTKKGEKYIEVVEPEEINLASYQQLSALFYGELECKGFFADDKSTDEAHLKKWAEDGNVLAKQLLTYRGAGTYRKTFVGNEGGKGLLSKVVWETDNGTRIAIVRTDFLQETVTGRLASRGPNLMNIPSRKDKDPYRIRGAFEARNGCKLVVADYSLIELRLMAHVSRDERMIKALKKGEDLHGITTKKVLNLKCPANKVKELYPDERAFIGKPINFGLQYGMKARTLAARIGVDEVTAEEYIEGYFDLYWGVYAWMKGIVDKARRTGYVKTLLGRRRRVLHLHSDEPGPRNHAENQAMNGPIQGGVADLMVLAMNAIEEDEQLREYQAELLLQIHDELVVECPWLYEEEVKKRVKEIMEGVTELRVPVIADVGSGDTWEAAKV